jgi:hypothetical protein
MAKAVAMSIGIPGTEISINYNTSNLRITSVDWSIPQSGIVARARIWDDGNLVYDRTVAGPATGSENVPGQYRVRQVTEDGQTFFDLPASLTYTINVETIGG